MKIRSKAQLRAISKSYTKKRQEQAKSFLLSMGCDYDQYCKETGWKSSPVRLLNKLIKEGRYEQPLGWSLYE